MITDLMQDLEERVEYELEEPVDIEDREDFPAVSEIYSEKRTWLRMKDVVVVTADMKGSTKLDVDKYANTSASTYEALMSNCVRCVSPFDPAFIDIQGDGLFALFHGERALRRGFCAAVTLKTFSERVFVPQLEEHRGERFPKTGLKTGMASGTLVVKKVGIRGDNEPIWAGKPVNWAFKAAQQADRHQLIVTESVYRGLEKCDFATHACGCGSSGVASQLWTQTAIDALPGVNAWMLKSMWCVNHGDEFCEAILEGKNARPDMKKAA